MCLLLALLCHSAEETIKSLALLGSLFFPIGQDSRTPLARLKLGMYIAFHELSEERWKEVFLCRISACLCNES